MLYIQCLRNRGGKVTRTIAHNSNDRGVRNMVIGEPWAQSLFRRMGFSRRFGTTSKVPIPEKARKEIELLFMHKVVKKVEKHDIPHSLILNADQTPSKYVPSARYTLAQKNSKEVPIAGGADKRAITATFVETLDSKLQLIYGGKTKQSLPKIKFPDGFGSSLNPSHFSNTEESIKLIEEVVVPYIDKVRAELDNPIQPALLIWDIFRGQKTEAVLKVLKENIIETEYIPNNMTNYYQPLNLTTNKWAKDYMKAKFSEWYSQQVREAIDSGKSIEDIEIKFPLSVMKPLHGSWLIDMCNELTSENSKEMIKSGWERSGIMDANSSGSKNLPTLDPFAEIDPLESEENVDFPDAEQVNKEYERRKIEPHENSDSKSEYGDEPDTVETEQEEQGTSTTRNAFDLFEGQ